MNNLRSDELASQRQIQEAKKSYGLIKSGIGLATGSALFNKITPLLNNLVPSSLAIKGLQKIDKRLGDFVSQGLENGFTSENILDFLRSKFSPVQEAKQEEVAETSSQQQQNPLQEFETNFPDIARALAATMQNGQSPEASAAILKSSTPFSKKIKDLEKKIGKNFVDYIIELFGGMQNQQSENQQGMQQQQIEQQMQQSPQQAPQQAAGGVDPQLIKLMQNITNSLQGLRGK